MQRVGAQVRPTGPGVYFPYNRVMLNTRFLHLGGTLRKTRESKGNFGLARSVLGPESQFCRNPVLMRPQGAATVVAGQRSSPLFER